VKLEGSGADGVPEKCRQIQHAHTICIRGMVSILTIFAKLIVSSTNETVLLDSKDIDSKKL
jgi:hypothetical protein